MRPPRPDLNPGVWVAVGAVIVTGLGVCVAAVGLVDEPGSGIFLGALTGLLAIALTVGARMWWVRSRGGLLACALATLVLCGLWAVVLMTAGLKDDGDSATLAEPDPSNAPAPTVELTPIAATDTRPQSVPLGIPTSFLEEEASPITVTYIERNASGEARIRTSTFRGSCDTTYEEDQRIAMWYATRVPGDDDTQVWLLVTVEDIKANEIRVRVERRTGFFKGAADICINAP